MNCKKSIFLLLFIITNSITAQVKIGERPHSIDAASIIELESSTKALVLTRVSEIQMQNITPLRGALIYNTDTQCVYYFDGNPLNVKPENLYVKTRSTMDIRIYCTRCHKPFRRRRSA